MTIFLLDLIHWCKNKIRYLINYKKNLRSDLSFLDSLCSDDLVEISPKAKVLLVEINNFHFECLDSIVYYFQSIGYGVDVVVRVESSYKNATKLELSQILCLLRSPKLQSYDFVFLNTMLLSLKLHHHILQLAQIKSKYGILGIYHSINDIYRFRDFKNYNENRYFSLRNLKFHKIHLNGLSCSKEVDIKFLNNDVATFISIGFPIYHRNFRKRLYSAIEMLLASGIVNFKFILIGRNDFKDLQFNSHILFYKNPTNEYLLQILKLHNPHYTLGIFDNFAHRHYLQTCTSGLRQFSLMYNLPFVISENFGSSFGFDASNAIFFDKNLEYALKNAINIINTNAYSNLKANLCRLNKRLNEDSISLLSQSILELKAKAI